MCVWPVQAKVKVISTIPDLAAIAREVGGDLVEIAAMVRPTQDPHFMDPKPSFVVALNKADLLLLAGMELEAGWLPPLLLSARNSAIQKGGSGYLDCSTLIVPMEAGAADRSKGDVHPGGNPHYWYDPRNGIRLAKGIAARLEQLDPAHAAVYRERSAAFGKKLEERIADWSKRLAPLKGSSVVVYHRSWVYFLDFAGLKEAGALEPKPGIPPSPSHVAELLVRTKAANVRWVIQESFYPSQLAQQFAQKSGARLLVLPTMVGADGTKSYTDVIEKMVSELTR
jgi:zinc/manganese transport system substrate-binding protein